MHHLMRWLRTFDEILLTTVTPVSQLTAAAIDIDRYDARRWRERLFRYAIKNDLHKGIPRGLRAFGSALVTGDLIFNRPGSRGTT